MAASSIDIDLSISFKHGKPVKWKGHWICYGVDGDEWITVCVLCGSKRHGSIVELGDIHLPHLWFYLFGTFDECEEPNNNIGEIIQENTNLGKYVGAINTPSTKQEIEMDILSEVPDHIQDVINVHIG